MEAYVVKLTELGMNDVERVGGKNASLGEMIGNLKELGVTVPGGFATTATAYRDFLAHDGLDKRIAQELATLDVDDVTALADAGRKIGEIWFEPPPELDDLDGAVQKAWV